MQVVTLIEIELDSGTWRLGPEDMEFPASAPEFYDGYIASSGSLKDSFSDLFTGAESLQTWNFSLKNNLGEVDAVESVDDFRGKVATIKRVDILSDTVLETRTMILDAPKSDLSKSSFSAEAQQLDIWQQKFPLKKINLNDFPDIPDGSDALGQTINIALGIVDDIPCYYIKRDAVSNAYDYLIGWGTLGSATEVRDADGTVIPPAEYTFYDGSQVSPFGGYAFLRFSSEQRNHSGGLDKIFVDVTGIEISGSTERNSILVLEEVLTNSSWGLSQTANAANFSTYAAIATSLNLKCDGLISGESMMAEDWKEQILFSCMFASLVLGENGYEVKIPTYQTSASGTFDSNTLRTVNKFKEPQDSFTKSVMVNYFLSLGDKKYQKNNNQAVSGITYGVEKEYNLMLVRDDETAARLAQYIRNKAEEQDQKKNYQVDDIISDLEKGDRVDINGNEFEIISTDKSQIPNQMKLAAYSSSIFAYVSEIPQGDPPDLPSSDPPEDISSLNIIPSFEVQPDGTVLSWFDVSFTAPANNFLYAMVSLRLNGGSVWQDMGPSDDEKFKLTGVKAGIAYDVRLISINSAGKKSDGVIDLNNLAAGDTTAPSTPSGFVVTDGVAQVILDWSDNTEDDFDHYDVYRATVKIFETRSSKFTDVPPAYNTNYSYQVLAVDRSGNPSTKTSGQNGKKLYVNGNDIDITTGTITIATGRDILFNSCCKLDATSLDFRIFPTTDGGRDLKIGGAGIAWQDIEVVVDNIFRVFCGSASFSCTELGFFGQSTSTKQSVTGTAVGTDATLINAMLAASQAYNLM